MTDSEILKEAILQVETAIDSGLFGPPVAIENPDLLPDLAIAICDRGLLQDFGRRVLETMLRRDLAVLLARRAILLSSVRPGSAH